MKRWLEDNWGGLLFFAVIVAGCVWAVTGIKGCYHNHMASEISASQYEEIVAWSKVYPQVRTTAQSMRADGIIDHWEFNRLQELNGSLAEQARKDAAIENLGNPQPTTAPDTK